MKKELIFELLNGKLLESFEMQPEEISRCQNNLDISISILRSTLNKQQSQLLDNVINMYTEFITLNDNYSFETGIKIGGKIAMIFKD